MANKTELVQVLLFDTLQRNGQAESCFFPDWPRPLAHAHPHQSRRVARTGEGICHPRLELPHQDESPGNAPECCSACEVPRGARVLRIAPSPIVLRIAPKLAPLWRSEPARGRMSVRAHILVHSCPDSVAKPVGHLPCSLSFAIGLHLLSQHRNKRTATAVTGLRSQHCHQRTLSTHQPTPETPTTSHAMSPHPNRCPGATKTPQTSTGCHATDRCHCPTPLPAGSQSAIRAIAPPRRRMRCPTLRVVVTRTIGRVPILWSVSAKRAAISMLAGCARAAHVRAPAADALQLTHTASHCDGQHKAQAGG